MPGSSLVLVNRALLLRPRRLLRRHHLHLRRKRNRRRSRRLSQKLMLVQYYHHHNQNNMPRVKENVGSQEQEVQVQRIRRKSHVISISLRNHARTARNVNIAMIRRSSTPPRMEKARAAERLQEVRLRPTRPRRLMNHVGTGQKDIVGTVTNAENVMMLIFSRQRQMMLRNRHRRTRLLL